MPTSNINNGNPLLNELILIQQLKQGNRQAFNYLIEAYKNMVYNTVLSIVQQSQEAEDVAQEVFIQVFQNIHGFRSDSKFSTWLYRIAISKALDCERKKKAKKRIQFFKNTIGIGTTEEETAIDFHHPGVTLDNKEQAAILFKAMQQLPENQKIAFTLIKVEGLNYDDASAIMNTTVKAIEALMHRAKENLRKKLQHYFNN